MRMNKSKTLCIGCNDDFYNGKNDLGIEECWCFEDAEIVEKRKVPITMRPPWDGLPLEPRLSCFRQKGYVFIPEEK